MSVSRRSFLGLLGTTALTSFLPAESFFAGELGGYAGVRIGGDPVSRAITVTEIRDAFFLARDALPDPLAGTYFMSIHPSTHHDLKNPPAGWDEWDV